MAKYHNFVSTLLFVILFSLTTSFANQENLDGLRINAIDRCWRSDPKWRKNRQQLATCSVGFAGKMTNNIGTGLVHYTVTNPTDDPLNPKPGSLRYGATMIKNRVWITFSQDMRIRLEKPLLISSFTAIDGRGVEIHIAGNACLMVYKASNVIIHGLKIYHCKRQGPGPVMGPGQQMLELGQVDGDAIRLVSASKIWIDHNTLYKCSDGLLDVTRGSTGITISNNWFREQDKVMLLGHDDGYLWDKTMKVTVAYNHFGPNCNQRMPRIRHGYAHVVNNLYQGWTQYAIGGSMNPSVESQANLFIASKNGRKEVTWNPASSRTSSGKFYSVRDVFENGASFNQMSQGGGGAKPNYQPHEWFEVADASGVRALTSSSGALTCTKRYRC